MISLSVFPILLKGFNEVSKCKAILYEVSNNNSNNCKLSSLVFLNTTYEPSTYKTFTMLHMHSYLMLTLVLQVKKCYHTHLI